MRRIEFLRAYFRVFEKGAFRGIRFTASGFLFLSASDYPLGEKRRIMVFASFLSGKNSEL